MDHTRNLIDGRRRFPAMPYEFEVRSPTDGSVVAAVPLSGRHEVARAVEAAGRAAPGWAADPKRRALLLGRLVDAVERDADAMAALQSAETGLAPTDSAATVEALLPTARASARAAGTSPGVTGIVTSWGLPLGEALCAALPALAAGHTVVLKPSLRAPLSASGLAHLAAELDFPAGVFNLVQGTGVDVGAALHAHPGLTHLHVRAGERTLAHAARAVTRARVFALRAGGNVAVAGPDADPGEVAAAVLGALRLHDAGGPLGLPVLAVHADRWAAVLDAVLHAVADCDPAPLPSEALRERALAGIAAARAGGAESVAGGAVPNDAAHRMGWRLPATVLALPGPRLPAGAPPPGPVLTVFAWRRAADLVGVFSHPRHRDGIACVWGTAPTAGLPHTVVTHRRTPVDVLRDALLPAAWTGRALPGRAAPRSGCGERRNPVSRGPGSA